MFPPSFKKLRESVKDTDVSERDTWWRQHLELTCTVHLLCGARGRGAAPLQGDLGVFSGRP